MSRQQVKIQPNLSTSKMPGERQREYTAWLLYCEAGSYEKTLRMWIAIYHRTTTEIPPIFTENLGKPVNIRTLKDWGKKYQWVKRTDLRLAEELEELKIKADRIRQKKRFEITDVFWTRLQMLKKQMQKGEIVTVAEIKALWEMMRTEWGESIGKTQIEHGINPEEQNPIIDSLTEKLLKIYRQERDEQRRRNHHKKS
ncbi:MAG: hypothetical protein CH104c_0486 [Candidatus Woesebacteria bacterium]|nr:MAG: hypothetical protein CH104c_0486 [Candidatus Woesebacteria bacterium]